MINSATTPELPRLNASQVDFGKLKGNGSFCEVFEVTSLPYIHSSRSSLRQASSGNASNTNASWDFTPPSKKPPTKNLLQSISRDMDNIFNSNINNNSNLGSKLGSRMSDSTSKLRNLILNTSNYQQNRFQSNQQILVAKIPKKNEDALAYEESVKNLILEAKILESLNHDNIIRIHAMSEDMKKSENICNGNMVSAYPRFFIILDCLSSTLDKKIEGWTKGRIHSRRSSTNDVNAMKKIDSTCSTSSAPGESVYKLVLNRQSNLPPNINDNVDDDSIAHRLDILLDISSAMRYIHKQNIMHRDIKTDNVGFDANGTVKIFDFGLAVELDALTPLNGGGYKLHGGIGTCRYMAPEVAEHLPYNLKADVYSFGMLMYNLLSLVRPYEGLQRKEWYHLAILGGRRPSMKVITDENVRLEVKNLIRHCWDPRWSKRPNFDQIESVLRNDSCRWYNNNPNLDNK